LRLLPFLLIVGLLIAPVLAGQSMAARAQSPELTRLAGAGDQQSSPPGGLGMVPSSPNKLSLVRLPATVEAREIALLPDAVDLSDTSSLLEAQPSGQGIPPVGNQLWTNTCVGWATSYYYKTYQEWLEHRWSANTEDHIFSPSFVYNQVARAGPDFACDSGAQISEAMELITTQGDLPYSEFTWDPFNCGIQPSAGQQAAALDYHGTNFGAFFIAEGPPPETRKQNHNLQPLKQWLANGDPFVLGFPVYSEFDNYDCFQVVGPPADPSTYRGLHAVAVIGYDNAWAGVGGFKIINSYGADWGCYGYAWLSYEFVRQYAWEAWWMDDNWWPWIEPRVPDHLTLNVGETVVMDLSPYENDREDSGPDLKWYVEGAEHCTVYGQASADDVLQFQPKSAGYTGYDEIELVLRDSEETEDRQRVVLGWFTTESYLPLSMQQ
jgi:C1A family cysteine protease